MKTEAVRGFRSFFQLSYLFYSIDDEEALFRDLLKLLEWSVHQAKCPSNEHDEILGDLLLEDVVLRNRLLLYLATLDQRFFDLACRMFARSLIRGVTFDEVERQMIAALLTSTGPGSSGSKTAARDTVLVLAVTVGQWCGKHATASESRKNPGLREASGCGLAAKAIGRSYSGAEDIWKKRKRVLLNAGFDDSDASGFLDYFSPMH